MNGIGITGWAVLILLIAQACGPKEDPATQVAGEWQGVRWTAGSGAVTDDPTRVVFIFQPPEHYAALLGNEQEESGTYRVNDGRLYTLAEGREQMMVRFERPHPDTLTLLMNRGGRLETLVLGRRK